MHVGGCWTLAASTEIAKIVDADSGRNQGTHGTRRFYGKERRVTRCPG